MRDALRNGGCAYIFNWSTLKGVDDNHGYYDINNKRVTGKGPKTEKQVLLYGFPSDLATAIKDNELSKVKKLLADGADLYEVNKHTGNNALHLATIHGRVRILTYLLAEITARSTDPDRKEAGNENDNKEVKGSIGSMQGMLGKYNENNPPRTPLWEAIRRSRHRSTLKLIQAGSDIMSTERGKKQQAWFKLSSLYTAQPTKQITALLTYVVDFVPEMKVYELIHEDRPDALREAEALAVEMDLNVVTGLHFETKLPQRGDPQFETARAERVALIRSKISQYLMKSYISTHDVEKVTAAARYYTLRAGYKPLIDIQGPAQSCGLRVYTHTPFPLSKTAHTHTYTYTHT